MIWGADDPLIKEIGEGDDYKGNFKMGKMSGHGIFTFGPKSKWFGDTYVGGFKNGLRNGKGNRYRIELKINLI